MLESVEGVLEQLRKAGKLPVVVVCAEGVSVFWHCGPIERQVERQVKAATMLDGLRAAVGDAGRTEAPGRKAGKSALF